jgi:hypothetical protein
VNSCGLWRDQSVNSCGLWRVSECEQLWFVESIRVWTAVVCGEHQSVNSCGLWRVSECEQLWFANDRYIRLFVISSFLVSILCYMLYLIFFLDEIVKIFKSEINIHVFNIFSGWNCEKFNLTNFHYSRIRKKKIEPTVLKIFGVTGKILNSLLIGF